MIGAAQMWHGPHQAEGRVMFQAARERGASATWALVLGHISSHKDGWIFRGTLAELAGCCIRTVQRAITWAKEEGLLGVHRSKKGEIPPGIDYPMPCGFSHRFTIGWGKAGALLNAAIERAKGLRLVRMAAAAAAAFPGKKPVPQSQARTVGSTMDPTAGPRRQWTAAAIDAELDRLERLKRPPD